MRARSALRLPGLRAIDGLLGAVLTACVGLGIAWIIGAVALAIGRLAAAAPRHPALGDPPRAQPAAAAVGPDPSRARALRPAAVGARAGGRRAGADPRDPRHAAASARRAPSVVRVVGTACGLGIEGSGWVAAPGLVVTNAHVVAGETRHDRAGRRSRRPVCRRDGGRLRPARRHRDPPRRRPRGAGADDGPRSARRAPPAAILGYPLDGPFDAEPGRIGQTQTVSTEDAYGNGPVAARDRLAARPRPARQLRRSDGRRRRPASWRPCSPRSPAAATRPRRLRRPERARAQQLAIARSSAGPVSTGTAGELAIRRGAEPCRTSRWQRSSQPPHRELSPHRDRPVARDGIPGTFAPESAQPTPRAGGGLHTARPLGV